MHFWMLSSGKVEDTREKTPTDNLPRIHSMITMLLPTLFTKNLSCTIWSFQETLPKDCSNAPR